MQLRNNFFSVALGLFLNATAWANITVPAGANFALPPGTGMDLACGNVSVSGSLLLGNSRLTGVKDVSVSSGGTLTAANSSVTMAGNFSGNGTVSAGSSSITMTDGCATTSSQLSGSLQFQNLTLQSSAGKSFVLAANTTLTISGVLTVSGTPGQPISLSASAGARIVLLPGASVVTTNGNITAPVERSSSIVGVPGLGDYGLPLLLLLMGATTYLANRKYQLFREIIK